MCKGLRFLKRHRKAIAKALVVTAITIITFILAHKAGTTERGYEALGGEMFAFLIPFFAWILPRIND